MWKVWALASTNSKSISVYRVYFGKHVGRVVILLGGSAKKRQSAAIAAAQAAWTEYRRRKGDKE